MHPYIEQITRQCRQSLLEDTLPFWMQHAIDSRNGGYQLHLDRKGAVYDSDKPIWLHGRFIWLLATLHREVEPREDWLNAAIHGAEFLGKHGFDTDGHMFFLTDANGRPLRKRRYIFSEVFATMGFSALASITHNSQHAQLASKAFTTLYNATTGAYKAEPKWVEGTRPMKGLALPMAALKAAEEFRRIENSTVTQELTQWCINEIGQSFYHPELGATLETVAPNGGFIDSQDGRLLCPGHTLEAGWFILEEAIHQDCHSDWIKLGCDIIDASWQWGWDQEYGGILYYRDVLNRPCTEYWHDMKFWWPHCEAIIANHLAYAITAEPRFLKRLEMIYEWTMAHFPDREFGEWYGYLHRDGRISTYLKGGRWKGPFHLPRMQYYVGWKIDELTKKVQQIAGRMLWSDVREP